MSPKRPQRFAMMPSRPGATVRISSIWEARIERETRTKTDKEISFSSTHPTGKMSGQNNVARLFLCLNDKHFPKMHTLHKLFNTDNVKVSYSYMSNMANIIKCHNTKILGNNNNTNTNMEINKCNCRNKDLSLLMAYVSLVVSPIKPLSSPLPLIQRFISGWRSIVSKQGTITTRYKQLTASKIWNQSMEKNTWHVVT